MLDDRVTQVARTDRSHQSPSHRVAEQLLRPAEDTHVRAQTETQHDSAVSRLMSTLLAEQVHSGQTLTQRPVTTPAGNAARWGDPGAVSSFEVDRAGFQYHPVIAGHTGVDLVGTVIEPVSVDPSVPRLGAPLPEQVPTWSAHHHR